MQKQKKSVPELKKNVIAATTGCIFCADFFCSAASEKYDVGKLQWNIPRAPGSSGLEFL